jgi:predicted AlkP superfamily phosphohydrolase/phosphomutase
MNEGYLSTLSSLRQQGTYGYLNNTDYYATETEWTTFLTGCTPYETGYWRPLDFNPENYDIGEPIRSYDFVEHHPFYSHLGVDHQVALFDMPQVPLMAGVNGIQIAAWGAQDPQVPSGSIPSQLFDEIVTTHGSHPAFMKCFGDNWWDQRYLDFLADALKVGISRRASICRDLLRRDAWDLFLTVFSETHSAGHNFWHLSQEQHPLHAVAQTRWQGGDPLLATFEAIDRAIADILAVVPQQAYVMVFSCLSMGDNTNELPTMVFLPELLYRFNFPGQMALAPGRIHTPPPPPVTHSSRRNWGQEVWQLRNGANPVWRSLQRQLPKQLYYRLAKLDEGWHQWHQGGQLGLSSPKHLTEQGVRLAWQPASWYRPLWPTMKAFALPCFSDGLIRINLKGREAQGIVEPDEYDALCDELTRHLYELRDARTGDRAVSDVVRTRKTPTHHPKLPDADLIVIWRDRPMDVVDSPSFGRIGPVPYRRSGGHQNGGFLIARGPGITSGSALPPGHVVDLAPTILNLMGATIPDHLRGAPLIHADWSKVYVG